MEGKVIKVIYICYVVWNFVEFKEMFNLISLLKFIFILNNNENVDIYYLGKFFFIMLVIFYLKIEGNLLVCLLVCL